jgi:hypothetical protein
MLSALVPIMEPRQIGGDWREGDDSYRESSSQRR